MDAGERTTWTMVKGVFTKPQRRALMSSPAFCESFKRTESIEDFVKLVNLGRSVLMYSVPHECKRD
jgi:hypothetical protein